MTIRLASSDNCHFKPFSYKGQELPYIVIEQECIPVGCVSTAAVTATRCQYQGGLPPGGYPPPSPTHLWTE